MDASKGLTVNTISLKIVILIDSLSQVTIVCKAQQWDL